MEDGRAISLVLDVYRCELGRPLNSALDIRCFTGEQLFVFLVQIIVEFEIVGINWRDKVKTKRHNWFFQPARHVLVIIVISNIIKIFPQRFFDVRLVLTISDYVGCIRERFVLSERILQILIY